MLGKAAGTDGKDDDQVLYVPALALLCPAFQREGAVPLGDLLLVGSTLYFLNWQSMMALC